jgi:hypothetical protein
MGRDTKDVATAAKVYAISAVGQFVMPSAAGNSGSCKHLQSTDPHLIWMRNTAAISSPFDFSLLEA